MATLKVQYMEIRDIFSVFFSHLNNQRVYYLHAHVNLIQNKPQNQFVLPIKPEPLLRCRTPT